MTGKEAAIRMRLLSQISSGMQVVTMDGKTAGKVKVFDNSAGMLVVEHGYIRHREASIPVSLVEAVDPEAQAVRLSVSKELVEWAAEREPNQALFKDM